MMPSIPIFTDAFLHRLWPAHHEVALTAMQHLDPVAYQHNVPIAALGALLASALLYAIGLWLRRIPERVSTAAQQARIATLKRTVGEWLPYLLILSPTPVGGILLIAAGFFEIRPWVAGGMVLAAEIAWRAAPLMS